MARFGNKLPNWVIRMQIEYIDMRQLISSAMHRHNKIWFGLLAESQFTLEDEWLYPNTKQQNNRIHVSCVILQSGDNPFLMLVSRDWSLELMDGSGIWQASPQQYCGAACQIPEPSSNSKYWSRGFETWQDLGTHPWSTCLQLHIMALAWDYVDFRHLSEITEGLTEQRDVISSIKAYVWVMSGQCSFKMLSYCR